MTLKISNAMASFDVADLVDLDCGSFDIKIRQAAIHNEDFRAAIARKALQAKKKRLVSDPGSLTGAHEEDVELFIETIFLSWGKRPMLDDDKNPVDFTPENLREIFNTKQGKVLFGRIQTAAVDDQLFAIKDSDLGNF